MDSPANTGGAAAPAQLPTVGVLPPSRHQLLARGAGTGVEGYDHIDGSFVWRGLRLSITCSRAEAGTIAGAGCAYGQGCGCDAEHGQYRRDCETLRAIGHTLSAAQWLPQKARDAWWDLSGEQSDHELLELGDWLDGCWLALEDPETGGMTDPGRQGMRLQLPAHELCEKHPGLEHRSWEGDLYVPLGPCALQESLRHVGVDAIQYVLDEVADTLRAIRDHPNDLAQIPLDYGWDEDIEISLAR